MMEHTTDRLFWTLTTIIIGALILTIGINAFPKATQGTLAPMSSVIHQADNVDKTANATGSQAANDAADFSADKANAVEASSLGFSTVNYNDHSVGISSYDGNHGSDITIPKYLKINGQIKQVSAIENVAFYNHHLTSVHIPDTVTYIGDAAFQSNNLTSISIPNSIKVITQSAFSSNQLTSIDLPNSITSIGKGAFSANNLTSVTIPNSVTMIGNSAFFKNNLNSVTIPSSVTDIEPGAFWANPLTKVNVPNPNANVQKYAFMPSVSVTNNS